MTNAENDIRACNNNSVNVANKMKSIQKECFWYLLCQHNCQDAVWFITMDSGTFDQFKWMSESQLKLPQKTYKKTRTHAPRAEERPKEENHYNFICSFAVRFSQHPQKHLWVRCSFCGKIVRMNWRCYHLNDNNDKYPMAFTNKNNSNCWKAKA